jgi:hypothetical protein
MKVKISTDEYATKIKCYHISVTRHRARTDNQANQSLIILFTYMRYHFIITYITLVVWFCHHRHVARLHVLITEIILLVRQLSIYPFVAH